MTIANALPDPAIAAQLRPTNENATRKGIADRFRLMQYVAFLLHSAAKSCNREKWHAMNGG
jgi:hypothetical protein